MISTLSAIVDNLVGGFSKFTNQIGLDVIFFIGLFVEVGIVLFFLIKSMFSYEAKLNRALEKLNYWLFEKKVVTEENIKELNMIFKLKTPKRLCYYWQQYILFREGAPSTYLSTDNLIEKPLKTSSYSSNIKNLSLFSGLWAFVIAMFTVVACNYENFLEGKTLAIAILIPTLIALIAIIFIVYLRYRKNSVLNSLYQNISLFDRFMDNACVDLPSYIDYQILFTPQEIENGQPVLREFLDYKARKEKEEFNQAKQEEVNHESYDFTATGVDGSIVLDRAMKECELYLKKKEKILLKVSQLESELDSRRKNFDNVQKDYQTKIQASKENVDRLRQMQEETTNRIESNYYRKQQTQEIGKQEQLEQEFEQQRAKYLLEKNEGEDEIKKLNEELENHKNDVEEAMISEYQTFFNKFCQSAQKVVAHVFEDKINSMAAEREKDKQRINELEIKLKDVPQGVFDATATENKTQSAGEEGTYDENGNYVFANGTYYDKDGNFHAENGDVYSQDGTLISKAPAEEKSEKQVVDFDSFDAFDFMTDTSQKGDIYGVAENIVNQLDENVEVVNNAEKNDPLKERHEEQKENEVFAEPKQKAPIKEKQEVKPVELEDFDLNDSSVEQNKPQEVNEAPIQKEVVQEKVVEEATPQKRRGRPRKEETAVVSQPVKKVGRPKGSTSASKKQVGRPRKIVTTPVVAEKRGRGRPKKTNSIEEINQKLSEEEKRISQLRSSLNYDLENVMNNMNSNGRDANQVRRQQLINEIEKLQNEAQQVISSKQSESKVEEINRRLEVLLDEIKRLN